MGHLLVSSLCRYGRSFNSSLICPNDYQKNLKLKPYYSLVCYFEAQKTFLRCFSLSLLKYKKKSDKFESDEILDLELEKTLHEDIEYKELMSRLGNDLNGINSVAVLQPWIKWGKKKRSETSSQLLLHEACALVKSIPYTEILYRESINLQYIKKNYIFGKGSLERVTNEIHQSGAKSVFISIDHLSRAQKCNLEDQFKMPVLDRFFVVLSIFNHHARTAEARLQVALAELPFMRKRFLLESERLILDERTAKLKSIIKNVEQRREKVRAHRRKRSIPSVAVVGYTNCGKTTLIRALTGDEKLKGENRLFATLDVTAHRSSLPCGLNVLYLDSVGFIQDIPTSLIASFRATLQDTIYSDAVVLVRDISHPDIVSQTNTVYETLNSLSLPSETPIIVVNNKVDLIDKEKCKIDVKENEIFTSSITGEGLEELEKRIQREIFKVTDRKIYVLKLPTGSTAIDWLKENMGVNAEEYDKENPQITKLHVVMNEAEKAAFKKALSSILQKR